MPDISASERAALDWVREHNVLFPTVGPGSSGVPIAQIYFMNWVLCRIGKYGGRLGRSSAQSTFAEVLHASSIANLRGADHMGEVIVQMHQDNQLFESGTETPSADYPSRTSLYFRDIGSSEYEGGEGKFYPETVTAADPFVYFAREMDDRLETARERLLDYNSSIADLAQRVAVDNPDQSAYQVIEQQIGRVSTVHGLVSDYEWLLGVVPGSVGDVLQNHRYSTSIRSAITSESVGRTLQAADFISTINSAAQLAVQVRAAAGPTSGSSQAFIDQSATLLAVLRVACSFLPILGDYYAAMFDGIPGLIAAFRRALDRKIERLNAIVPPRVTRGTGGRLIQPLPNPPSVERCARCNQRVRNPCRASRSPN